ncbi:hypothetical protein LCGC14_3135920 [marine sediment metagenome]|uniref:Uncharacterized protein n=1 Tax=marine sediment metagenome TaxID=412755 RepID=A0A0F8WMA6_9ZZZZ
MTLKETEIQRALGTLPLWRRIQLGDVELVGIPVNSQSGHTRCMSIAGITNGPPRYYYREDIYGSKENIIQRLIEDCKKGNWRDD